MKRLILLTALALGACGSATGLKPREGVALPVRPYGAAMTPTPQQLITPTPQQRPARTDELLRSSEERRSDEFDLPPT